MTTQDEMQILMRNVQSQIQTSGVAKIKVEKPLQKHRGLYKAFKRYGWKMMRLAHDENYVYIRRSLM